MTPRRSLLCPFLLLLTGCAGDSPSFPPPPQRQPVHAADGLPLGRFISMNDPYADAYLVHDISPAVEGNAWRWAYQRPELRFYLPSIKGLKFSMDFAIPEITFRETGPVTLSIRINGQPLAEARNARPGQQHFETAVPPALLKAEAINLVAIQADKVWISKEDGARLGFILSQAGFVP